MKISLAIKTLFRTMGKTLFTFLLIAVLTFSLFIQLAEYVKTSEEFKKNVAMYQGTGYVEYRPAVYKGENINYPYYIETDPRVDAIDIPELEDNQYPAISAETVDEIAALPYVSSVYKRYMTAGVSDQYQRLKEDITRYDYNGRVIIEGTMDQLRVPLKKADGWTNRNVNGYTLRDAKVLAGDTNLNELLWEDGTVYFEASVLNPGDVLYPGLYMQEDWVPSATSADYDPYVGGSPLWDIKDVMLKNYPYGRDFQESFKEGERYVFVCRFERQATARMIFSYAYNATRHSLSLYDWVSEHCCPSVWNITDAPENYLDLPEYAPLKELIDVTQADLNTFDVVYADDMTAIQRIHDNTLHLTEGRWLTSEDTENDAKVCVIDGILAKKYDLKLGDTLSLRLGNALFEQFYSLGAIASVPERFSDEWTQAEFEIVGIYSGSTMSKDANEPNWAYSMNTVFVPLASLPLTEDELAEHEFAPGEFTFRVDNAWNIGPFLEEVAPKLEAMGLTLTFDDGGWMTVLEGYRDAQRIPMIRILLLAFVTATGLALSVYLFVSRKKKDYAIMRALGTPKGRSGRALLVPMLVLSLAAVLFGVAVGTVYSQAALGVVPALPVLLCIGGELAFTLVFTGLSIRRLSGMAPLALLQASQGATNKQKAKKHETPVAAAEGTLYHPTEAVHISHTPLPITKQSASLGFRLRYVLRHLRRQGFKSALAVLLAALMVGAVVQFASLRDTYNELRETTVITAQYINSLSYTRLQPLVKEGFAKDIYYERIATTSCLIGTAYDEMPIMITSDKTPIVITSDLDRFLNQDYEITLGEGYTEDDIGKLDRVLVSSDFMKQYGLRPGDIVQLGLESDFYNTFDTYTGYYLDEVYYSKGLEPETDPTREEVHEYYKSEIDRRLAQVSADAVVIGSISAVGYKNTVFTAGLDDGNSPVGTFQTMPLIEFTLADNERAEELRQRGEEMTHGRKGAFVMDTEALESVIRTSDLLNGLYPAVVALALLIGAAMCALLVMQTGKDAAIMRALGTTKCTTRVMLALEQILLGFVGVLIGLAVMLAWKRGDFSAIAVQAGVFAAAYAIMVMFGSYISAAFATRKNILELLQTKE